LQGNGAFERINYTRKLSEQAIAHKFKDTTMVPFDLRLEQFFAPCLQTLEGTRLIALHERRVSYDIRGDDHCEAAFHANPLCRGKE
jgi:hypothetical protein